MTAGHVIGDRGVIADVPTRLRARRTNDPLAHVDLTTAAGRRIRDLFNGYVAALGTPLSAIMAAQVLAATEAVVIAEQARQRVLEGDRTVTLDDLIRVDAQADRKVRRLGIGRERERHVPLRQRLKGGA